MSRKKIHPYLYIIFTFISVIVIGMILLSLPFAYNKEYIEETSIGNYFANAFFMSSSAVCVTGLSVMPSGLIGDMSVFGKIVMILLMEIGGLSIITIAVFFFTIMGAKIGISNSFILRESLNQKTSKEITNLVKSIVILSVTVQVLGILINWYPIFEYTKYLNGGTGNVGEALFMSVFHAAASFNNAGFDILGPESTVMFSSAEHASYGISAASMVTFNISTMLMIFCGGIGIVVFKDVFKCRFKWKKMNLHTKITLITTVCLIVFGTLFVKLTCMEMGWLEALFTSITCRTAGFQTYRMSELTPAASMVCMTLMLIGASPCSCGGGIKTTTFAIIMMSIFFYARGKKAKAFNRSLEHDQILKAFILVNVAICSCIFVSAIVVWIQPDLNLGDVLFEVVSAFSTTGLSRGITTDLAISNKVIISFMMLLGRLGPLTVIGTVNKNWINPPKEMIRYVEESVIIG